jgi:hypothetical protein
MKHLWRVVNIAATARPPVNWFLGICLAAFLTPISASAVAAQTVAEEWVVAQATAGALGVDLSRKFPEEKAERQIAFTPEQVRG